MDGDRPLLAKPYSYDLRKKVIEAIQQDGMKKSEVSQSQQLSKKSVSREKKDLWLPLNEMKLKGKIS